VAGDCSKYANFCLFSCGVVWGGGAFNIALLTNSIIAAFLGVSTEFGKNSTLRNFA
jgi:hypothetical protein